MGAILPPDIQRMKPLVKRRNLNLRPNAIIAISRYLSKSGETKTTRNE